MPTTPKASSVAAAISVRFTVLYALAMWGLWTALLTPVVMTLALRVAEVAPAHKERELAWILGIGAIVAMVANPVAGLLSDRTTGAWGMRRPWIVGGLIVGSAGLALAATGGILSIAIGWWVAQLGFNAMLAALLAVLPDQVPEDQRGRVSGVVGICIHLGILAGIGIANAVKPSMVAMLMLPCLLCALLVLALVLSTPDRRLEVSPPRLGFGKFIGSFWIDPRKAPDFAWAFVSRFLLFMGLSTLLTYQVYYLTDNLKLAADAIPGLMLKATLVTTATTVLGSLAGGWLSDKLARRRIFVLAAAAMYAVGLLVIAVAEGFGTFLGGLAIAGVGQGVYLAVDLALVTSVLPNQQQDAAKDLGIFNLASAMPQSIAPAVAPLFLAIGNSGGSNYVALFAAAAAFAAMGALAVIRIRGVR